MSDTNEQTTETTQTPTVYITGADTGAGLALIDALARQGYRVLGATTQGTAGAVAIRALGGVPVYSDLYRAQSIMSDIAVGKASVVVHLAPNTLNSAPHTFPQGWQAQFDMVASAGAVAGACQQAPSVKRLIAISPAYLYGDTGESIADESAHLAHDTDLQKTGEKAEEALRTYANTVIVRAGYTFGAYSPTINQMAQDLIAGKAVAPSHAPANWLHEDDLVSAIITLIQAENPAGVYNAVAIHATPDEFANAFGEALGVGVPNKSGGFAFFDAPETPRSQLMAQACRASSEALMALGWQPLYDTLARAFDRTTLIWRAQEAPATPADTPDTDIVSA